MKIATVIPMTSVCSCFFRPDFFPVPETEEIPVCETEDVPPLTLEAEPVPVRFTEEPPCGAAALESDCCGSIPQQSFLRFSLLRFVIRFYGK